MPRPFSVTLLALAVFCLAGFNLLGAVTGLQEYAFWRSLPLSISPVYLIAARAFWAAAFGAAGVGLWRLKQWGRSLTLLAGPLFAAQGWLERLALTRSDFARATWPWALGVTAVSLALLWGILLRGKVRRSFSA
jgi:hypothetical protein